MRIGIVSDIHGNAAGLGCALERMGDVDELICLGDVVEEYRFENDAVALLRDRQARCVLGNHDIGLLSAHGARARSAEHVDQELVRWLESQPSHIDTTIGGARFAITHASPCAPHTQYVLPHSAELKRIAEVDADVVLIGHSHRQMVARAGRALVINPGSAGQARDHTNGKRLSYAVLDVDGGEVSAEHVTIDDYTVDEHTAEQVRTQRPAVCGAGWRAFT